MYTRLAFQDTDYHEGRRIVELQTSQALINSPQEAQPTIDQYGRKPFQHPALNGLQGLSDEAESKVLDKVRLSQIAERYDLDKVTRWKPKSVSTIHRAGLDPTANTRQADNLKASGIESVLMTSLYAIVGAVALEQGGEVANKVVQDKILAPLGFTFSSEL
jgi:large subunit ribosomal protein L15